MVWLSQGSAFNPALDRFLASVAVGNFNNGYDELFVVDGVNDSVVPF